LEKDKEKELLGYFLPAGTLDYFDITHFVKDKEGLVLFLEEQNTSARGVRDISFFLFRLAKIYA
jgi:hypothetical protein